MTIIKETSMTSMCKEQTTHVDSSFDSQAAHTHSNEATERKGATSAKGLVRSHHQENGPPLQGRSPYTNYHLSIAVSILEIWMNSRRSVIWRLSLKKRQNELHGNPYLLISLYIHLHLVRIPLWQWCPTPLKPHSSPTLSNGWGKYCRSITQSMNATEWRS